MARDRDEKQLLPLVGMDQIGIIKDVPGHILPPTGFTDGKNIFFKNSSVHKRKGTIKAVDDVAAIVATVTSTAGQTMTFNVDPALTVNSEFTIANATPSNFNGTYNVTAVSDSGKTITVSQTLNPYTSGGTYTFTPKIDFVDYWSAPNNPQYVEVQQNDSATPAAPVFNSIRAGGIRERISLKTYEVENISASTTPTITIDGDPFNLTEFDLSGAVVVKPVVEREIKAGETLKVFGANPNGYDGAYVVTSITYNTGTTKTEISCSSASVNTSSLAAYNTDSAELRRDTFSPTSYLGITSQDWQSTFFAGGYAYILNDGYHTPHYLLASLGANYVTPQLTPLPGWDWQRYLGEEVHVSCKVIRGYKDTLIAGNLNHYPIVAGVPSINPSNSKPGTIRISRTASAGSVPTSWQPALTEAFVEERELSTTSEIMDIVSLQGTAMVYTTNSIHSITYDSRGNVSDQVVAEGYGALETGCVLEFDGKHIVIGADDIYMFGGHPGSIQSICNGKIRDYFYNNLSPTPAYLDNIFMVRDTLLDEIHIYYPTKLSPNGFCNEYLAWNYRNNTWTINECNDLVSGFLGPVRGGGVAGGTVTFAGVGNTTAVARTDQQSITVDLDANYPAGSVEVQTLDYSASPSATASTYNEETLSITVPSGIIPFNEEAVEFNFHDSFNSGSSSRNLGTDSGTGSKNNLGNNSGINISVTTEIPINQNVSRGSGWTAAQTIDTGYAGVPYSSRSLSGTVNGQTLQTSISGSGTNSLTLTLDNVGYYLIQRNRPGAVGVDLIYNSVAGSTESGVGAGSVPSSWKILGGQGGFVLNTINEGDAFSFNTTSGNNSLYELSNIPFGAVISVPVGGQTLTQSNTSHTFADGLTDKSWSFSGSVPTVTHSSTTNADGTLATGSGTTSPTDISSFVGFNLTEAQISANATTSSSGTGTKTQTASNGEIARTVVVGGISEVLPSGTTFQIRSSGDVVFSGAGSDSTQRSVATGSINGVSFAPTGFTQNGATFAFSNSTGSAKLFGYAFSEDHNAGDDTVCSIAIVFVPNGSSTSISITSPGSGQLPNLPSITNSGDAVTVFTGRSDTDMANQFHGSSQSATVAATIGGFTISSQTANNNFSNTTATVNASTGVVSFPQQNKTIYTLTNGSSSLLVDVDLTVGGTTVTDSTMNPSDVLTITFPDAGSARAWSVKPGAAATFAIAGDGAFPDISARSFPANVGAATAVSYVAGIVTAFNPTLRAQPKASDNTILQIFYNNPDVSGTNSNITLSLVDNDGTNITADGSATSTGSRTAQGTFFTQYRIQIHDNQSNEVTNVTPLFNSSNITLSGAQNTFASQVGQYLRDQIITTINNNAFMTNEPDWYDNGSSGAIGSDYVVRIASNDIENYSITVTNINTTNSSYPGSLSGTDNTFTFSDALSADSTNTPDTLIVKDPFNRTLTSLTTRTGETIESVMDRVATAVQADTNDGWGASHNTSNDTITFTATAQGRYPIGTGAPADSVYTDYAVISFDYTQGSNVISAGNIPDINASITTQGSDEAVTLTLVDPSRDNSGNTGPFEDTFDAGGTTNQDVANSIKNRIDAFWANWSATVTDTGVAASGTATGNQFKVTLTSNVADWILKDRVTSTITANDVVYPTDRAVFVKAVAYGSGVTGSASSAATGTNFDAASNKSGNFIPADIQIGYPVINPTSITVAVQYANTTVSQSTILPSAGNSDSMASGLASILNSSAVPALSATSAGSILSITTNDLSQQINNITFTFDTQTTQGGRNSVSRTNGNNIAGSGAIPSTTLALDTVTDADRPYSANSFNLNKFYPIVANQTSILCEGIGYTFNADPPNSVVGSPYNSFVERIQLPIDNSVEYKKDISYVQLLVDEGNLLVKFKGSDSPGEKIDLTSLTGKVFDFDSEYKLDFRENGRVFNIRIEDATSSSTTPWKVSGYGFKTERAESRGKT